MTKFLNGINESYEQSRLYILMLKPISTTEEALNIVTHDERQRAIKPSTKVDNVAFQAMTPMAPIDTYFSSIENDKHVLPIILQNQRLICTHFGNNGHTIQSCFKLIGFPPGSKTNGAGYGSKNQLKNKPSQHHQQNRPTQQMQITYHIASQQANVIANVHSDVGLSSFVYAEPG